MYIALISAECAPVAKVGGLADVVRGLSRELSIRGNQVELILPKYDCMRYDHIWGLSPSYHDLWVPYFDQCIHCDVYCGEVHGLRTFFIDAHGGPNFFLRGCYYGQSDDPSRFASFSKAALEFLWKSGRQPDLLHCHDWQSGLVPVLLYETYAPFGMIHPRVCYTLHNVHHQGVTGEDVLRQVGLNPEALLGVDRLGDPVHFRAVNLMKGGIVYSNFVTTVSPRYMDEIRHTDLGCGLQDVLNTHGGKTGGVLNGVDYDTWNPVTDPLIPFRYGPETLEDKFLNKEALRDRFLLRKDYQPILAVVSRLDSQKGVGLMRHALFYALANGTQFVLLGSAPDPHLNQLFWDEKNRLNDNEHCHLEIGYNEELSHLIYAGADMILVPSAYEPCGLTQMIAMKYGSVPVVRETGGLADTVFDANYADQPFARRNGYTFRDLDPPGLESALGRAIGMWYSYPEYWRELMLNGINADYSCHHPGQDYVDIYEHIRDK